MPKVRQKYIGFFTFLQWIYLQCKTHFIERQKKKIPADFILPFNLPSVCPIFSSKATSYTLKRNWLTIELEISKGQKMSIDTNPLQIPKNEQ